MRRNKKYLRITAGIFAFLYGVAPISYSTKFGNFFNALSISSLEGA